MSTQTHLPDPLWSASSGRFVALVLIAGLLVFCAGSFDALLFAGQFQQECAQIPQPSSCTSTQATEADPPIAQPAQAPQTPRPTIEIVSGEIRYVTSVQLNVRARPGADQSILLLINRDERVRLLGESVEIDGGTWVYIEARGVQGWVNV